MTSEPESRTTVPGWIVAGALAAVMVMTIGLSAVAVAFINRPAPVAVQVQAASTTAPTTTAAPTPQPTTYVENMWLDATWNQMTLGGRISLCKQVRAFGSGEVARGMAAAHPGVVSVAAADRRLRYWCA